MGIFLVAHGVSLRSFMSSQGRLITLRVNDLRTSGAWRTIENEIWSSPGLVSCLCAVAVLSSCMVNGVSVGCSWLMASVACLCRMSVRAFKFLTYAIWEVVWANVLHSSSVLVVESGWRVVVVLQPPIILTRCHRTLLFACSLSVSVHLIQDCVFASWHVLRCTLMASQL